MITFLQKNSISVFLILTILLLVIGFLKFTPAEAPELTDGLPKNDVTVSLKIANAYQNDGFVVSEGDTVLDALIELGTTDPALQLETQEYEGLGTLITSMYGSENGSGNMYWQYEVNGVMPQIGAGAYELTEDDAVEWKFTESQY